MNRADPTIRPIPGVGPSRDSRGGLPLPRPLADILIGLAVMFTLGAIVVLLAHSPAIVPLTILVLLVAWPLGHAVHGFYGMVTEEEGDPWPPPPPPPYE